MYIQYSIAPIDGKYLKRKDKSGRRRFMNGENCLGFVLVCEKLKFPAGDLWIVKNWHRKLFMIWKEDFNQVAISRCK